jgi:hypothetical protein
MPFSRIARIGMPAPDPSLRGETMPSSGPTPLETADLPAPNSDSAASSLSVPVTGQARILGVQR